MYYCKHCPRVFETYKGLNGHQRSHAKSASEPKVRQKSINIKKFTCIGCSNSFEDYAQRNRQYCSNQCQRDHEWIILILPRIWKGEVRRITAIVKFLTDRDGYACSICRIESWMDKPLTLDVDHIDGNPENFLPENLRLLCPNCHRQTETWGNSKVKAQMKNGRRRLAKRISCDAM